MPWAAWLIPNCTFAEIDRAMKKEAAALSAFPGISDYLLIQTIALKAWGTCPVHCFGALVSAAAQASFQARCYKLLMGLLKYTNQSLRAKPCRALSPLSQGYFDFLLPSACSSALQCKEHSSSAMAANVGRSDASCRQPKRECIHRLQGQLCGVSDLWPVHPCFPLFRLGIWTFV